MAWARTSSGRESVRCLALAESERRRCMAYSEKHTSVAARGPRAVSTRCSENARLSVELPGALAGANLRPELLKILEMIIRWTT